MPYPRPLEPPAVPLTDGVVTVRTRRAADVDVIAAASHDPEARRWLDDVPAELPVDDAGRAASLARVAALWASGRAAPLVVADAVTDEPVGLVNLQFRDDDGAAAVAYSVFAAHRGRGVAVRAVELAAAWAFDLLGLAELRLEADEGNLASLRVAAKAGFERTGTRTERGDDGALRTTVVHTRPAP